MPLHLQPAARDLGYVKGSLPIAEKLSDQILSLPIFPGMTDEQQGDRCCTDTRLLRKPAEGLTIMHVPYNYLPMQFADYSEIAAGWDELIQSAEFTLGSFMETFEREFAEYVGARHCVMTNNGTDALILSLKSLLE